MTANTSPIFILTPHVETARLSGANTTRDASSLTNMATCFTASANGSLVNEIRFTSAQATAAANSAMVGRIFVTDTSGTNPRLLKELAVTAVTASNTAIGAQNIATFYGGLALASGQKLLCSISVYAGVQDQTDVVAIGGDF